MGGKKRWLVFAIIAVIVLISFVSASRVPTVNGDSDSWGTVLNDFLMRIAGENATELNLTMVNGTNIYPSAINSTHLGTNSVGDDEINYGEVTLTDFTNDANYLDKDEGGTIDGSLIVNGNLTLIGSYLNATVTNQYLNGSFFPSWDNFFDLGSSSYQWKNLFLNGTVSSNGTGNNYFMGNVGIGVSNPSVALDVTGAIRTSGGISHQDGFSAITWPAGNLDLAGAAYGYQSKLSIPTAIVYGVNYWTHDVYLTRSGTSTLLLSSDNSSGDANLMITGNVGVNTTSPQNALNVVGDGNFTTALYVNEKNVETGYDYALNATGGSGNVVGVGTYGYLPMWNDSSGGLNNSPLRENGSSGLLLNATQFQITGGTGVSSYALLLDAESGSGDSPFLMRTGTNPYGLTDSDTKFRVTGAGNVGINLGTKLPTLALEVGGQMNISGALYSYATSNFFSGKMAIGEASTSRTNKLSIVKSSSTADYVDIVGANTGNGNNIFAIRFKNVDTGSEYTASSIESYNDDDGTSGTDDGDLRISTANAGTATERMRILAQGNVGINSTSPQNMLNVVGDINATKSIFSQEKNLSLGYDYALNATGGGGGNPFDQSLNTTDDVSFNSLTLSGGLQSNIANATNFVGGWGAGASLTGTGLDNVLIGNNSGKVVTTGDGNVAIGSGALSGLTIGNYNVAIGTDTMQASTVTGTTGNTVLGTYAGYYMNGAAYNVVMGYQAGYRISSADNNVILGYQSNLGVSSTGSNNIFIGYKSAYDETGSNTLIIDNRDRGSEAWGRSKSIIYGIMDIDPNNQTLVFNANVGINTTDPQNTLNVLGDVNATNGFVVGANTGLTDSSSYWLCTASDCSTSCQVQISGGIITGCA